MNSKLFPLFSVFVWLSLIEVEGFRFASHKIFSFHRHQAKSVGNKQIQPRASYQSKLRVFIDSQDLLTAKLLEPVVNVLDEEAGFAKITVTLDSMSTDEAYKTAISQTTEKLKQGGAHGAKLLLKADNNIVKIVGEQNIKNLCSSFLYEKVKEECRKTNLPIAGNVRIEEFNVEGYQPGKPHAVTVHADLLPRITYDSEKGYFGLQIAVHMPNTDTENHSTPLIEMQKQFDEVKESIMSSMSAYRSQLGDLIIEEYDYESINKVRRMILANTPIDETLDILEELNASVVERIEKEVQEKNVLTRVDALNFALLAVTNFSWIPDSFMQKFAINVMKETCQKLEVEGYPKKEIDKLFKPAYYAKSESLLHNKIVQVAKLRLIYDDIITREQISLNVTEREQVESQLRTIVKEFQQGIDEERVRQSIERAMLQQKVIQLLLPTTDMEYPVETVVNNENKSPNNNVTTEAVPT